MIMNGEMIYPRCVNRLITKQEGRQTIRENHAPFTGISLLVAQAQGLTRLQFGIAAAAETAASRAVCASAYVQQLE